MFTSYAQNFEDVMLWRALKHVDHGFYIDIGAQDPVIDSVSLGFYEQGWRGVHVEPVAAYAQALRERRPEEVVLQTAVGARHGTLTLYAIPGTGLSTARRDIALEHGGAGFTVGEVEVECLTLEQVLAPYAAQDIHWLKVDVEGLEGEVLAGWGAAARPWIVVVESTLPRTQSESHHGWEGVLLERGYAFAWFDGLNRFYVSDRHPELMRAFQYGPTPFDEFELSATSVRADGWRRESHALVVRAAEAERKFDHAAWQLRGLEQRLEAAQSHGAAAEAHIAALTGTVSWRVTAPLRSLRAMVLPRVGLAQGVLLLAKRSGAYQHLAPWLRERYPGMWARAKRALLSGRGAAPADRTVGTEGSVATRGLIAHDTDAAEGFDAIAARGSVDARELASLIERRLDRRRGA
ncbi:MAG: FkbM family methyltransferase [Casimicrobiaceae bacterium]